MSDAALPFRESFCFNTLTIERVYMCSCCFLEHVWIGFLYGSSNFLSSFHLLSNIASYLSTVLRNTRSYLSLEHDKNAKRDNYALASMLWFYEAWVLWKLNHIRARNISGTVLCMVLLISFSSWLLLYHRSTPICIKPYRTQMKLSWYDFLSLCLAR